MNLPCTKFKISSGSIARSIAIILFTNHDGRKQPREKAATLRPAPSEHGDSPITDGAVGGVLGDSEVICMGAQGA